MYLEGEWYVFMGYCTVQYKLKLKCILHYYECLDSTVKVLNIGHIAMCAMTTDVCCSHGLLCICEGYYVFSPLFRYNKFAH